MSKKFSQVSSCGFTCEPLFYTKHKYAQDFYCRWVESTKWFSEPCHKNVDLICFVAKREDIFAHDPFDPLVFRFHMFVELICDFWMPFEMERKNAFNKNSSHSIHVWYIYQVNIPYMDGMGLLKFCGHVLFPTKAPAQKQVYKSTEDFL